jgi:hypothetical protein
MSDHIQHALSATCEWMDATLGEASGPEAWREDAIGIITTFLRALPLHVVCEGPGGVKVHLFHFHLLADEIERLP